MDYNYYNKTTFKTKIFNSIRSIFKFPFFEKIISYLNNGKESSSVISKLVPAEYLYRNPSWRNVARSGIRYRLNLSNVIDHYIFFGYKDLAFINFISKLSRDSIVFDIGANIGATSLPYAKKCSEGMIYSYEPDKINFERLKENIDLNSFKNITLNNIGLGDKEEEVKLYRVSATNPGMNRILKTTEKDLDFTTIKINTLDNEVFEKYKLVQLDAIKIDVEGFEHNVLNGADRVIETFRPIFFIELIDSNLKENGSSAISLVGKLIEKDNYKVFEAQRMHPIETTSDLNNCRLDIIAIPNN
jgi:FkbM family methyltransferase